MSKNTRNTVATDEFMVGKLVRMLDGVERRIKARPSSTSYSMEGTRTRVYAYHIRRIGSHTFEQVSMEYAQSASNIVDCGGFAHFQFGDTEPAMATQNDLSTLLVGTEEKLPEGAAAETQRFVVALVEQHLFASTAAHGSARIASTSSSNKDDATVTITLQIDMSASLKVANMTADGAFAALQCAGRTISELRRMSDDDLMDAYCALLKSTN